MLLNEGGADNPDDDISNNHRHAILGTDGRYGYARDNEQLEPIKPLPDDVPFEIYSSLMGMLATNGAKMNPGPN
jgi:hypothetical protein